MNAYENKVYRNIIEKYNTYGENMICGFRVVKDICDNQIKIEIEWMGNKDLPPDPHYKGWLEIFEDVLKQRRLNKIKKIKSNLNVR